MLTDEIKSTVKEYASGMSKPVSIIINVGVHDKRQELIEFIKSISSITDLISFTEKDISDFARSPITFTIEAEGKPTGIYFSGIPSGHEFNSLILAILQSGGVEIKLEDRLKLIISNIRKKFLIPDNMESLRTETAFPNAATTKLCSHEQTEGCVSYEWLNGI